MGFKFVHIADRSGWKYGKTGELSGDLCKKCGGFMIIDKKDRKNQMRCQDCGRVVKTVTYSLDRSAYR